MSHQSKFDLQQIPSNGPSRAIERRTLKRYCTYIRCGVTNPCKYGLEHAEEYIGNRRTRWVTLGDGLVPVDCETGEAVPFGEYTKAP